jgi:hypothetical protein
MSPNDIPKSRERVYNQGRKVVRSKSRSTGPPKIPNLEKLLMLQQTGEFLRDISFSRKGDKGKPATFTATQDQLNLISNFCRVDCPVAQLHVDMTYKCGPFYVTVLTMPHPMFVYRKDPLKHPSVFVGMTTSSGKDVEEYQFLASALKRCGKVKSLIYGTDGEVALERGMEDVFPIDSGENIHLRCFDHVKEDIKRKLDQLQVPSKQHVEIVAAILGTEFKGKRTKGLVDYSGDRFKKIEKICPPAFISFLHATSGRTRSIIDTIKRCMSREACVAAGLGNPPNKFTNQRAESMNSVLKEEIGKETTDMLVLHELVYERIVKQQRNEFAKAVFKMGEYHLASEFKHLEVEPSVWCHKSGEQKESYLKKVFSTKYPTKSLLSGISSKLSVTNEGSKLSDLVPENLLDDIWNS